MSEVIIEFEAILLENTDIQIDGCVNSAEIDDAECIQYYDNNGFEIGYNFPTNPYNEDRQPDNHIDWEKLALALQTDDLLLQYLWDYRYETVSIDRGEYILKIYGEKKEKKTTVQLTQTTKNALKKLGSKDDSYENIITDLYHHRNFWMIQDTVDENATDLKAETIRVFEVIKFDVPSHIKLDGCINIVEYNTITEAVIEVYCLINNILSPL